MTDMLNKRIEEILEAIWTADEGQERPRAETVASPHQDTPLLTTKSMRQALEAAINQGLIITTDDSIDLTEQGKFLAAGVVRRHRLAERLLQDVLDLETKEIESSACKFEHLLSREATNSICILLGHPPTCPHGKPIPPGACCQNAITSVRPLVTPLNHLRPSERGRVAYIGTREKNRLDKLASLGITPETNISLEQRHPSFVIKVDETQLGIDDNVAAEIYVRRLN